MLNERDIRAFDHLFSPQRIDAIADRFGEYGISLPFKEKRAHSVPLTATETALLLLGVADVRLQDVQALFTVIKTSPESLRHLNTEQIGQLVSRFNDISAFSELTKAHFDDLMLILCPFASIDEIFSGEPVIIGDKADDSGKTLKGIKERIRLCQAFRMVNSRELGFTVPEHLSKWNYVALKRLVDREPPEGCIIPHPNGYYVLHKNIHGGGAYKLLLKALTVDPGFESCILYRGTRAASSATDNTLTLKEDAKHNIGSLGPRITLPETLKYLTNPACGFVSRPDEKVKLFGFSLGGVHAMRDTCLFPGKVSELWTLCSPGLDSASLKWFSRVSETLTNPITVKHVVEFDDEVHRLGRGLLGLKCDPSKVNVTLTGLLPGNSGDGIQVHIADWLRQESSGSVFGGLWGLMSALGSAHIRNTIRLDNYHIFTINNAANPELANMIMDHKSDEAAYAVERARKTIALEDRHVFRDFLESLRGV